MEEDSVKEEELDLAHLPTADDPDNIFECYIKQLDQERIENMSKSDIIQLTAKIARKNALRDESKIAKKE